ncbi:MAG: 16S rRNA (guanine(966)-N(2))-methyltransferase RsmD [Demequinaceae bacterium]|nr:16S rRNA (guanine(966)-N(2))-methyltransferase RsmD [Demequinaceae bacterium]
MTRIIAGSLRGRRIKVPTRGTRPTTDRVREAVFGRLDAQDTIRGARVLDAFAGSGALGIEALSRGAAQAVFVESSPAAARVIEANLRDLALGDRAQVVRTPVKAFLASGDGVFDLALLDPPYDLPAGELSATLATLGTRLAPSAVVVLEWSSRRRPPEWPEGLVPEDVRKYGETSVHYASAIHHEPADGGGLPSGGSVEP